MNINNIPKLLEQIPKCDKSLNSDSENMYNIFEVMGVEYNEVIVCRFIGNLLDPKGKHRLGVEPLRLFICNVLQDEVPNENLESAVINLEEHTNNDRRVDIVIHLNKKVYPIEVKIWASDQDKQLEDYHHYFFGESGQNKIYYLTPKGREPSKKSKGDLPKEQISCISFYEHIMDWLKKIQEISPNNVKFVVTNFMEVIKKMNEQSTELKSIFKELELDDDNRKYNTDEIKSAISLLKYRDEIWDRIRKNYIREIISHNGYELVDCDRKDQKDEESGISHILMYVYVMKDGKKQKIAWICAETNLYIVIEKKEDRCTDGWTEYNNNYQWKYIDDPNNNNQHIKLNAPTELRETKIELENLLSEL